MKSIGSSLYAVVICYATVVANALGFICSLKSQQPHCELLSPYKLHHSRMRPNCTAALPGLPQSLFLLLSGFFLGITLGKLTEEKLLEDWFATDVYATPDLA